MSKVAMPKEAIEAKPEIQWKHIDGPLMHWAGQMHWLTWGERFMLWLRMTTPEVIAFQRFGRRP